MSFEQDPLSWILGRCSHENFLSEYMGKKHLLCKSDHRDRFRELLTFERLDEILGTAGLRFPDLLIVRSQSTIGQEEYVWKDEMVDPMRAARLFAEGSTIIFNSLQDRNKALQQICSCLARQASSKTQANIYLTPPKSQGFNAHWDSHDVFILQVEGEKHWQIYDGGEATPLPAKPFDPESHEPGNVVDEFVLEAGDVLYIPRGVVHAGDALDQVSIHITLGLIPYTWADLVTDCLVDLSERDPSWRESLPFGFGRQEHDGYESLKRSLLSRLADLSESIDLEGVVEARLGEIDRSTRPPSVDPLRQAIKASEVGEADILGKRVGLPSKLKRSGDCVVLVCGERELEFPATAQRTLEAVLQGPGISYGDIEDELDESSRNLVVSTLIREGIVEKRTSNL